MYVQRSPVATVTPLPLPSIKPVVAQPTHPPTFATVYDLAVERDKRTPPQEVLDAVADAARVYELLDAAGMQVRLDLSAGVSAQLRDHSGALVRPLTLHEVMDPSSLLPPDAAA